jgi:hypothetical protein
MKATGRRPMQPSASKIGCWTVLFAITVAVPGCGGKTQQDGSSSTSGRNSVDAAGGVSSSFGGRPATGTAVDAGGVTFQSGGSGGDIPINTDVSITGGRTSQAGSAGVGQEGSCDGAALTIAIINGAVGGLGNCTYLPANDGSGQVGRLRGAVVLDGEGRVVDNTGLTGASKQAWLDALANQRWSCYAGQTLQYLCSVAP